MTSLFCHLIDGLSTCSYKDEFGKRKRRKEKRRIDDDETMTDAAMAPILQALNTFDADGVANAVASGGDENE